MAGNPSSMLLLLALAAVPALSSLPTAAGGWSTGDATWYGGPYGDGSEGGACGYKSTVGHEPFSSMIAAGGPSLFNNGKGCGSCYKVKCHGHPACSGHSVTVVITDSCADGTCQKEKAHFDMSGTAFSAMAKPGMTEQLRTAGILEVKYEREPCKYHGMKISFKMDSGANPYYLAVLIEYEAGDGDLASVEVMEDGGGGKWMPMRQSSGAVWCLQSTTGKPLNAPFSFRLTSGSGKVLLADNVVPDGWNAGKEYQSKVNFAA